MQIYDTSQGPALLVRSERRAGQVEHLFAVAVNRGLATFWRPEIPPEYQLVHDPGGRADADVFRIENEALLREKVVLLECMEAALGMLDERSVEAVREIYRAKIKPADVVSLTKPGDLVGTGG